MKIKMNSVKFVSICGSIISATAELHLLLLLVKEAPLGSGLQPVGMWSSLVVVSHPTAALHQSRRL